MDMRQVLSQVESGFSAPSWQVLWIRTGALIARMIVGVFGLVFAAIGIGFPLFLFSASQLGGFGGPPQFFTLFAALIGLVFVIVGGFIFVSGMAAVMILMRPKPQRPVLVLTPDGVVERGGLWGARIRSVAFSDIAHARMRVTTSTSADNHSTSVQHAIVFHHLDGRKETWRIDGSYGRPDDVISRILTAQIQFAALHGPHS